MKYHIVTFGCQMNRSDSERIATVLEVSGLSPATKIESADLIVINSCSVRQSAINRIFGLLNNLKKAKRKNKLQNIKTILTGCILDTDKKKLADKFDLIVDIKELTQKPKNLINFLRLQDQEFKAFDYTDYFKINPQYRSKFSAYIPIMTGCNNFCAYCAVPYTRGREVSRPAEEIINEIKMLVGKGYKEITLLGQNVNSYASQMTNDPEGVALRPYGAGKLQITNKTQSSNSKTKTEIINFPKLLKLINNIPGEFWIRFLTSHPKDMSDKLIKTMVKCEKVTEYVHLPIQSGNDEILNKMNRHYTKRQYLELIDKIRQTYNKEKNNCHPELVSGSVKIGKKKMLKQVQHDRFLPVAISTDIIVGFPGETKKQFASTARVMRRVEFDMAYLSEYSPRAGTAAAKTPDTVSIAEKKRRKEFLNEILRKTALANNKKYVGKTVDVLIEKTDDNFLYGKTRTFKNVKISIPADVNNPTSFVIARIRQQAETKQSRVNLDKHGVAARSAFGGSLAMTNINPGQFAKIKITKANAWNLEGKIAK